MKIGGLQPVTLLDYPQKVAAIIFTSSCNMRCPFCYNSNLVLPEKIQEAAIMDEEEVVDFLIQRKKYLDGLVITGGEPAMQNDLLSFCKKMKEIGYSIKLDTNGLCPDVIRDLLDNEVVDYIAMDIKGPLDNYKKFCGVQIDADNIKKSIKIIRGSGLPYEFRSTLVKGLHSKTDVDLMAKEIKGAKAYFLQNFSSQSEPLDKEFGGRPFDLKAMEEFRGVASQYVKNSQVR